MSQAPAGPASLRLFIGVQCPPLPAVLEELQTLQQAAREPRNQLRVVPAPNLHLTLKFLGSCDPVLVPALATTLDSLAATTPAFVLDLQGAGSFHGALWLGVQPLPVLAALVQQLNSLLAPLGFAPETKPYRPHLTLARLGHRPAFDVRAWQQQRKYNAWGELPASHLTLYRSDTLPTGAHYTALHHSALR